MKVVRFSLLGIFALLSAVLFQGCETVPDGATMSRSAMNEAIRAETPGDYFIGRRFYKQDYKFWGWVRQPGQPWSASKLVMFNEQKMLAPDRAQGHIGSDNNYEYRLSGYFSGEKVYEPASNTIYPEFVITGAEVRSTSPAMIFSDPRSIDPAVRLLTPPM